ncbi:hypothetical protein [Streptomyces mirabilis]|uniref:hypothetical protein n=1 Tax=Streptomyces mirabilis TaxID=68239 RepID=UPI00368D1EEA
MTTTRGYGSWANHGDSHNVSVEATIADAVSGGDQEWRERMEDSGAFARVARDYRTAINEALPDGVCLLRNDFQGPAYEDDYTWEGDLDIHAVVEGVDLQGIINRHDVDDVMTS